MKNLYTKIIRYDNEGFMAKPYKSLASKSYLHNFAFIQKEIINLYDLDQTILNTSLYIPSLEDSSWTGCFCHLKEYDQRLYQTGGGLHFKKDDKKNIAYLPNDTVIWVRNLSHIRERFYFRRIDKEIYFEGKSYRFWDGNYISFIDHLWVPMKISVALQRIELWKQNNNNSLPEMVTEFYLKSEQFPCLIEPEIHEKIRLKIFNKKRLLTNKKKLLISNIFKA